MSFHFLFPEGKSGHATSASLNHLVYIVASWMTFAFVDWEVSFSPRHCWSPYPHLPTRWNPTFLTKFKSDHSFPCRSRWRLGSSSVSPAQPAMARLLSASWFSASAFFQFLSQVSKQACDQASGWRQHAKIKSLIIQRIFIRASHGGVFRKRRLFICILHISNQPRLAIPLSCHWGECFRSSFGLDGLALSSIASSLRVRSPSQKQLPLR